ncbi:MAG: FtsW/RodA/SpoVE family cell cycle protein [Ancrocorticia sp.]|uniref:FtsW/RodA/SpoVE family cell cycle protein n=1 Tax=Ancrocorticia sp. TaxID=2593684 RepID=UPI003F8FC729
MADKRKNGARADRPGSGKSRATSSLFPRLNPSKDEAQVREVMRQSVISTLIPTFVLLILGLVMVYSATAPAGIRDANAVSLGAFRTANNHLVLSLVGVAVGGLCSLIPLRWFAAFANWLFGLGLALQVLVLTPLGVDVGGNTNWIQIAGIRLQPSELLKIATVVWLAAHLARLRDREADWRAYMFPTGIGAAAAFVCVMLGGDLGTGLIFILIAAGAFWLANMPARYFVAVGAPVVVIAGFLVAISDSRRTRVTDFAANLFAMPDSQHPTQPDFAMWAFGSGGIGGSGLGTGAEKWPGNLAEAQTDYIFAVIGEELGFGGCALVICMFLLLGWSLIRVSMNHPSKFGRISVGLVAIWICGQAFANMLVVTGLLPVFGVPLPFMSQGGTAVIAALLGVGVSVSAMLSVPGVRDSFKVRGSIAQGARAVLKRSNNE